MICSRWFSVWASHPGIKLKQLFQPLGVILEAAADVDALQRFIVALVGFAQVGGHVAGVVEVGNGGREMCLARQQDILGAAGQVGFVLFGERGDWEGVPAESVGVAVVCSKSDANGGDPLLM